MFRTALIKNIALAVLLVSTIVQNSNGRSLDSDTTYSVLIVTAHPDDDAMFSGSVYRLTHHLGGTVDLALITDGAGGYRFSTLSEPIYGVNLSDSSVAAEYLPGIRKRELMAGGAIVGIRNYYFMDQPDSGKKLDPEPFLSGAWDSDFVTSRLRTLVEKNDYDFIFALLPREDTHAHHKAATIYALDATKLVGDEGPLVLGAWITSADATGSFSFTTLKGYPQTAPLTAKPNFTFDRTAKFGVDDRLDYKIIVNWLIAEHKSQGTMQLLVNRGDIEEYWVLGSASDARLKKAERMFKKLQSSRKGGNAQGKVNIGPGKAA